MLENFATRQIIDCDDKLDTNNINMPIDLQNDIYIFDILDNGEK